MTTSLDPRSAGRRVRRLVLVALLAAAVIGCSGGNDELESRAEVVALRRQFALESAGQFGELWDELHPAQQEIVSRENYVLCAQKGSGGAPVDIDSVKDIVAEEILIPGTSLRVDSRAITVTLDYDGNKDTTTYHMVPVGGSWRWVMASPTSVEDPATC